MRDMEIARKEYISQTEHALKGMFDLLRYYDGLFHEAAQASPVFSLRHSGGEGEFQDALIAWQNQPSTQQSMGVAATLWEKHSAIQFSRHVIAGSILQIACKAIELFSTNDTADTDTDYLFQHLSAEKKAQHLKFLVGRKVKGIHIGLVIYAGRNQYNHFEQTKLSQLNRSIFHALALEDATDFVGEEKNFKNPSFDLDNLDVGVRSSIILSALGWRSYSDYESDIQSIFTPVASD